MKMLSKGIVASLDVGGSRVACVIAEYDPDTGLSIRGVGNRACKGISGGVVVDMLDTENAIRASVEQAEKMAGETISTVILAFSGGDQSSKIVEASVDITGQLVTEADIHAVIQSAQEQSGLDDAHILHAFPAAYFLDGAVGNVPPVGMYGKKLGVAQHFISANKSPLMNLEACVRRAHLDISHVVSSPLASAMASMVDDEAQMGAACIDIGAGTTSIAVMAQGALVHSEVLPIGGEQITEEIARALLTPLKEAERLKTFNGAATATGADDRVEIEVMQVGEDGGDDSVVRYPRSVLRLVMQKELETLFATIAEKLDGSGFSGVSGKRVVLTGGVAQTEAIRDLASGVLDRNVRIGRPPKLQGLPSAAHSPSFSCAVGLLMCAAHVPAVMKPYGEKAGEVRETPSQNPLIRMIRWYKDNF